MRIILVLCLFFVGTNSYAQLAGGNYDYDNDVILNQMPTSGASPDTGSGALLNNLPQSMPAQLNTETGQWGCSNHLYQVAPGNGFTSPTCTVSGNNVSDNDGAGASHRNPTTGQEVSVTDACDAELKKTAKQCKGAEWSQFSAAAIQTAMSVMTMKNAGKYKDACEAAQKVTGIGALSNAAVSAYCYQAISSCKRICVKDSEVAAEQCDTFNLQASLASRQAIENAAAYAGSANCASAAAGKCQGQAAYNDEDCTQFCMKPGRQEHPKCVIAFNNCSNQSYAAQNVQYCTCLSNPLAPSCRANAGTPIPGSGTKPGAPNLGDDGIGGADYDFNGVDAQGKAASTNAGDGGGSGFNPGGGGSSAFGDSGGGGSGDDPLNKEILTGTGGAAGAGGGYFGGGGYGEGNGGGKAGGGSGEDKGIDLSAFLPGGKKDPTRNPASAGYGDPSITKANGLTNWQKVTRKMNEKRPELMP